MALRAGWYSGRRRHEAYAAGGRAAVAARGAPMSRFGTMRKFRDPRRDLGRPTLEIDVVLGFKIVAKRGSGRDPSTVTELRNVCNLDNAIVALRV